MRSQHSSMQQQRPHVRHRRPRILRDDGVAEDAVQDALITAWRQTADPARARSIRGLAQAPPRPRVLRGGGTPEAVDRESTDIPAVDGSAEPDRLVSEADRDALERAFRDLSVEHRAVFVLHHHVGLPLVEIAETLGIPSGTARSRLHTATRIAARGHRGRHGARGPQGMDGMTDRTRLRSTRPSLARAWTRRGARPRGRRRPPGRRDDAAGPAPGRAGSIWRSFHMTRLPIVATVVAALVVVIGGGILLIAGRRPERRSRPAHRRARRHVAVRGRRPPSVPVSSCAPCVASSGTGRSDSTIAGHVPAIRPRRLVDRPVRRHEPAPADSRCWSSTGGRADVRARARPRRPHRLRRSATSAVPMVASRRRAATLTLTADRRRLHRPARTSSPADLVRGSIAPIRDDGCHGDLDAGTYRLAVRRLRGGPPTSPGEPDSGAMAVDRARRLGEPRRRWPTRSTLTPTADYALAVAPTGHDGVWHYVTMHVAPVRDRRQTRTCARRSTRRSARRSTISRPTSRVCRRSTTSDAQDDHRRWTCGPWAHDGAWLGPGLRRARTCPARRPPSSSTRAGRRRCAGRLGVGSRSGHCWCSSDIGQGDTVVFIDRLDATDRDSIRSCSRRCPSSRRFDVPVAATDRRTDWTPGRRPGCRRLAQDRRARPGTIRTDADAIPCERDHGSRRDEGDRGPASARRAGRGRS